MAHAIGIDVGTTNVKAALVRSDGALVASAARPVETRRSGDVAEQDAEGLWAAVRASIGDAVASEPTAGADVAAIGCCSQYSSIVPVRGDGTPVADMVLWQDRRGTDHSLALLEREGGFESWVERHGVPPVGDGLSLAHILHFQHDRAQIHAPTSARCSPASCATTAGSASRTPTRSCWSCPAGTLRPDIAVDVGLPNGVVVAGAMNDSHADLIATGALAPGRVGLAIGTTSVLLDVVDRHGADLDHEVVSVPTPFGTYLVWAETDIGGRALDFVLASLVHAADELGDHAGRDAFAGFAAAVEAAPAGSNGVMFLPWLTGSLAPDNVPSMRGAFLNLGLETRRIDLVRAATEGVGHSLRWLMPYVEAFTGNGIAEVALVGGAARSAAFGQVLADVLDRPVLRMCHPDQAVARAVVLVDMERHGALDRGDLDGLVYAECCFEPTPAHRSVYESMHEQFLAAFDGLRPVFERLNP